MSTESPTTTADLADYVRVIKRHWVQILIVTAICGALAVVFTRVQNPGYDAAANVQIPEAKTQLSRDQSISDVQTEVQVMKSEEVAKLAAGRLNDGRSSKELLAHLRVGTPTDARVLVVSYNAPTPAGAQRASQALAEAYIGLKTDQARRAISEQTSSFQPTIDALTKQVAQVQTAFSKVSADSPEGRNLNQQLSRLATQLAQEQNSQSTAGSQPIDGGRILSPAALPESKAGTSLTTNLGIGLLIGVVLGLILTFTRDRFDEQVRGGDEIEHITGVPSLGAIPAFPRRHRTRPTALVMLHAPDGAQADAFRRLRSSLLLALRAADARVFAFSSANAGEGKSTVSANAAVSLAQAGYRVCLVSADVRRPTLNQFFEVEEGTGLMDVLEGTAELDQALTKMGALTLITSGHAHANPTDLLQSAVMDKTLASLSEQFDYVVLDTSPVLAVADVLAVVPMIDAVVLVVSASETSEAELAAAEAQLRQVGANIIGAVINRSAASTARYDSYYRANT